MVSKEKFDRLCDLLDTLRNVVDKATTGYIRTSPVSMYHAINYPVVLDIRDLLIIGAITESDVLLTGKTGSGKTTLAAGIIKGLFGTDGYYAKTTLPTMNPSEFMDIDFPAILEGRKTLKEATSGINALVKPGIVLNEVNRAPGVIQSLLIAFLDRELEVQGVPIEMGRSWHGGRYQFRVLTINEGDTYQVQRLDPAIRDRMIIEIPVDAFPQTKNDIYNMLAGGKGDKPVDSHRNGWFADNFDKVVKIRRVIDSIPVHPRSVMFLNYLAGMSYCIRAPRGTKESIHLSPEVCEGCHHMAAFYNICGNIEAPSSRILLHLQRISRAFALFRFWRSKMTEKPVVLPEDIVAASPFLFYSKLNLNPLWIKTAGDRTRPFLGDRWTAIHEIMNWVLCDRFLPLVQPESEVGELVFKISLGQPLIQADWERIHTYMVEQDPWICDPAMVIQNLVDLPFDES